jgi:hypothetical protein
MVCEFVNNPPFRSGAFKMGLPIQPVIIKYDKNVFIKNADMNLFHYPEINCTVTFLDEIPLATNFDINGIRKMIAEKGDFIMSDVEYK